MGRRLGRFTGNAVTLSPSDTIFVQHVARGGTPLSALSKAVIVDEQYHPSILVKMMLARPDIQLAIDALRQSGPLMQRVDITRDSIIEDVQGIYDMAIAERDGGLALKAKELQARLKGLLVERKEITQRRKIEDMTDDQLLALVEGRLGDSLGVDAKLIEGTVIEVKEELQ